MTMMTAKPLPPIILPEILGFSPQLLLDDIVDVANNSILFTVDAMEPFILRWAQERARTAPNDWDGKAECEMGIISLQTLLENHTDIAFDALEAWSLRNIFTLDPELPIVLPHHRGLDLRQPDGADTALMHKIEHLRRQLNNERRLKHMLIRALRKSAMQRRKTERCLEKLSNLITLQHLSTISENFKSFYRDISLLAPPDPELSKLDLQDPTKRQWAVGNAGYTNWAVGKLFKRADVGEPWNVAGMSGTDHGTGDEADDVKAALEAMEMDTSP